jgi:molybdate transport system permease protein
MDLSPLRLSLEVAALSSTAAAPFALAAALYLARSRSPLCAALDALVSLPLVLPPLCVGWMLLWAFGSAGPLGRPLAALGLRLPFTFWAAVLAAAVVSFPLFVRAAQVAFEAADPRLEGLARTLGAGELDVFLSVTLPRAARGVAAGWLLAFSKGLGEFGATVIFAGSIAGETRTIPLAFFHYFNVPGAEAQVRALLWISVGLSAAATLAVHALSVRARAE